MADKKKLNEEVEKEVDDAELEKIEEGIVPDFAIQI